MAVDTQYPIIYDILHNTMLKNFINKLRCSQKQTSPFLLLTQWLVGTYKHVLKIHTINEWETWISQCLLGTTCVVYTSHSHQNECCLRYGLDQNYIQSDTFVSSVP